MKKLRRVLFVCLVLLIFAASHYITLRHLLLPSFIRKHNPKPYSFHQAIALSLSIYSLSLALLWSYLRILLTPAGFAIDYLEPGLEPTPTIDPPPDQHPSTPTQDTPPRHPSPLKTHDTNLTRVDTPPSPRQSISPHLVSKSNHHSFPLQPIPHAHLSSLSPPSPLPPPSIRNTPEPNSIDHIYPTATHRKARKKSISQILETDTQFNQFLIEQFTIHLHRQLSSRSRDNDHPNLEHYCKTCKIFKPPRTHHCRMCNTCVLRMDHQ